jgi:hypothetical protein
LYSSYTCLEFESMMGKTVLLGGTTSTVPVWTAGSNLYLKCFLDMSFSSSRTSTPAPKVHSARRNVFGIFSYRLNKRESGFPFDISIYFRNCKHIPLEVDTAPIYFLNKKKSTKDKLCSKSCYDSNVSGITSFTKNKYTPKLFYL